MWATIYFRETMLFLIMKINVDPANCFPKKLVWVIILFYFTNFYPKTDIQCVGRKSS